MAELKWWERKSQDRFGRSMFGIVLSSAPKVISISIYEDEVEIREQCDEEYTAYFSPQDAIEALEEAIAWIKEQMNG